VVSLAIECDQDAKGVEGREWEGSIPLFIRLSGEAVNYLSGVWDRALTEIK